MTPTTLQIATRRARARFSLFDAVAAASLGKIPDGIEGEIHSELRKEVGGQGGILIPPSAFGMVGARLTSEGEGSGSEAVFTRPGPHAPALLPEPVIFRLGATEIPDPRPSRILRELEAPAISWVGEDPEADVPEATMTFGSEEPPLRTAMATLSMTRQLDAGASFATRALVERALRRVGAVAVDRGALAGTGSDDQPQGLLTAPGVTVVPAGDPDGGPPTWAQVVALRRTVAEDDAYFGPTAFLGTPGVRATLEQVPELGAGGTRPAWRGDSLAGELAVASSLLPGDGVKGTGTDLHALVFGAWASLIVQVAAFEVLHDPYALKKRGGLELTLFAHMAVGLAHPASFAVTPDIEVVA
jgi:HK97 family phage major capsid protein